MNISTHISRETDPEERVVIYTLTSISASILSLWGNDIQQVLTTWPADRPYMAVHDLSHPGVGMPFLVLTGRNIYSPDPSPFGRQRVAQFLSGRPTTEIRIALVISPSVSGDITRKYGRPPTESQITYKVFPTRESALDWLLKH